MMEKKPIELNWMAIGGFKTPNDCLYHTKIVKGTCGQTAIAAILELQTHEVFSAWGVKQGEFKHHTPQKDMRIILQKLGYQAIQKRIKDNQIPKCNLGIIRVVFGEHKFWMEATMNSHYIGIKKMPSGNTYIFDSISEFDGKETNGLWIHKPEYYTLIKADKMHLTSYLELTKLKEGVGGIPPKSKDLGILPTIL